MKRSPSKQYGFTLIELMLVIVIITVMMVSAFRTMQEKATALQVQRAAEQMQSYLSAAQDYYIQNGYWPGSSNSGASSDGDATNATAAALYEGGYISSSTLPLTPWGAYYSICPYAPTTSGTSSEVQNFTCKSGPNVTGGNVSFRTFIFVPSGVGIGVAGDIAALLPNGVVLPGATNNVVQGSVLGPGASQDMANYIKNATTVQPLCFSSAYSPTTSATWPPPMQAATPQIPAPTGTDCPQGWIPQIYTMTTGFNAANLSYSAPEGGNTTPYIAGYYAIPVARYSQTTNTSGQHLIAGWDIYGAAIQQGGVMSASVCTTSGASPNTSGASQGGLITVFTKCVPPIDSYTVLPTNPPQAQVVR